MSILPPVVIIAGGLGTRIKQLSGPLPKALVPVNGKPFIDHQMGLLEKNGVSDVVLCLGHGADAIVEHVGDGSSFNLRVQYSFDGEKLLGTAGAVKKASEKLADEFLVLFGDSYLDVEYQPIYKAFSNSSKQALMTVFRNEDRFIPSNILFADGAIKGYSKEPGTRKMQHCDFGLSCYKAAAFENVTETPCDLALVTDKLISGDQLAGFEVSRRFYEVGTPEGVRELEQYLLSR